MFAESKGYNTVRDCLLQWHSPSKTVICSLLKWVRSTYHGHYTYANFYQYAAAVCLCSDRLKEVWERCEMLVKFAY